MLSISSVALSDDPGPKKPAPQVTPPAGAQRDLAVHSLVVDDLNKLAVAYNADQARQQAVNHIRSNEAHIKAIYNLEQCKACHSPSPSYVELVNAFHASAGDAANGPWMGVAVGPADEVLRSQLRLPEGTGLVITEVMEGGPAKSAGVEAHDILLSVNGQPVPTGEALTAIVRGHGEGTGPLTLSLLRAGQRLEKQVAPQERPGRETHYIAWVGAGEEYRIGVDVAEPDATLRKQLRLAEGGLVVTTVAGDSPAERQGLKVNDVLLSAGGKPLKQQPDLAAQVQQAGAANAAVELELLRGGVTLKIGVTPQKQPGGAATISQLAADYLAYTPRALTLVQPGIVYDTSANIPVLKPADPAQRLEQMTAQLDELRKSMDALRAEMEKGKEGKKEKTE
jgi:membrane-associated protease RseP (regulator of RpoE activity)